jgi:hypothetical protein
MDEFGDIAVVQLVICVDKTGIGGVAVRKAFVEGGKLSLVVLEGVSLDIWEIERDIFPHDLLRIVYGPVIDDDGSVDMLCLVEDTFQRLAQILALIVGNDNSGD